MFSTPGQLMERRKIHPQGPTFSRIITGVWKWSEADANEHIIQTALDEGITTFDHADIYGNYSNEAYFGTILKRNKGLRNKMELVTKCGIKLLSDKKPQHRVKHYDTSYEHIIQSAESSLQNFGTDRIDLLLIHRPDPLLNPEEVAKAFSELKQSGKVLHFGVSNFTVAQLEMLQSYLPIPLVTNQVEISLFQHNLLFDGLLDTLLKHRMGVMAWSPLGSGRFFHDHDKMHALGEIAGKYQVSVPQLMFSWLLTHPSVIFPITGSSKPERIKEAAQAISIPLDRQDWFIMLKIIMGAELP
jgi:predicted oxidoreductase